LVTGGARGIGRAAALGLARAGARVVVNYRSNDAAAEETVRSLPGEGHLAQRADVADPSATRDLVERVVDQCGQLDILVNNAGVFEPDGVVGTSYEAWQAAWDRSLAVNLTSAAHASHCAVQHMMRAGKGRIIFVGSRGAYRGDPGYLGYVAAKAGMKAMAQSLAIEVAPYGIFAATVAPGFVDTEMAAPFLAGAQREAVAKQSPTGRITAAEEVAAAIVFLATTAPEAMTGCVLDVNGASWLRP